MVLKFLWNGAHEIKYEVIIQREEDGGLGLIDLKTKIKAIPLSWVLNLCYGTDNWKATPIHYFRNENLLEVFHQRNVDKTPNKFYSSITKNQMDIPSLPINRTTMLHEYIWSSPFLKIHGNT